MSPLLHKDLNNIKIVETEVWIRNVGGKEIVLHVFRKCGQCQNIGTNSSLAVTVQDKGEEKEEKPSNSCGRTVWSLAAADLPNTCWMQWYYDYYDDISSSPVLERQRWIMLPLQGFQCFTHGFCILCHPQYMVLRSLWASSDREEIVHITRVMERALNLPTIASLSLNFVMPPSRGSATESIAS